MTPSTTHTPDFVPGFASPGGGGFRPLFAAPTTPALFQPLSLAPFAVETDDEPTAFMPSAEEVLRQAHEQAAQILADAEREAATQLQATLDVARQEQVAAFETIAAELLGELRDAHQVHQRQLERETAGLVVGIVRRVLHERFEADETAIVPVVRDALQTLTDSERVQVVVAPRHQAALRAAHQDLLQVLRERAQLEIVTAEAAEPYGCVVHGDESSLDARLESRLQALQHAVDETLASDSAA